MLARRITRKTLTSQTNPIRQLSVRVLDYMDLVIYSLVGLAFFGAAVLALGYSILNLAHGLGFVLPITISDVLGFVSDLLLVLIIMEVLGTVRSYLEKGDTSVQPFLFIGIISATRGILSIGARLSISEKIGIDDFRNAMIELSVNALVIITLGVTLRIMGSYAISHEEATPETTKPPTPAGPPSTP